MEKEIIVIGATGNLGGRIVNFLLEKKANVIAIVRIETSELKITDLKNKGVTVHKVDTSNKMEISKHCKGASCMVSAISGLSDTIINAQKIFLDAALDAKIPRFIPSDYSIDFTYLINGQNRNLDFRREFHQYLNNASIKPTTIFNGAFMDLLTSDMPLILLKQKRILCWGNPDQVMEFTTIDNVAAFTAEVALDGDSPRYLRIAGDRLSCNDFVQLLSKLTGNKFKLFRPGSISLLNGVIHLTKFFSPSSKEIYPAWQGMQYMRDMMEGRIKFENYSNQKYQSVKWTNVHDFLKKEYIK